MCMWFKLATESLMQCRFWKLKSFLAEKNAGTWLFNRLRTVTTRHRTAAVSFICFQQHQRLRREQRIWSSLLVQTTKKAEQSQSKRVLNRWATIANGSISTFWNYLSRLSFTAFTSVENSISMTVFFFRSSQIITAPAKKGHCLPLNWMQPDRIESAGWSASKWSGSSVTWLLFTQSQLCDTRTTWQGKATCRWIRR